MAKILKIDCIIVDQARGDTTAGKRSISHTTTGNGVWSREKSLGTTEEEWTIDTAISNVGQCIIQNLGSANYIEVGFSTGVYPIRIPFGVTDKISLAPATASLFLKANTAACDVLVKVHEA